MSLKSFLSTRANSIRHALHGWFFVIRTQQNAWLHAVATGLVLLISAWLGLKAYEWALLIISIGLVWSAEFFNTALECLIDLKSPQIHPLAKLSKDVGAAAVLLASVSAVVVGFLIMGPPLYQKIIKILNLLISLWI
jgi:diacylglycerol kinase